MHGRFLGPFWGGRRGKRTLEMAPATNLQSSAGARRVQGGCREGAGRVQGGCKEGASIARKEI